MRFLQLSRKYMFPLALYGAYTLLWLYMSVQQESGKSVRSSTKSVVSPPSVLPPSTPLPPVPPSSCNQKWPNLELFVTFPNNLYEEFHDQLLRSLLFFWPLDKLNMVLVLDAEAKDIEFEQILLNDTRQFNSAHLEYNAPTAAMHHYARKGHDRQQLVMFWADNFTKADYVGFVDTDTFFVTPVDVQDLFEDGKPVVIGLFGNSLTNKYWLAKPASNYQALRLYEPMRCMNYFPVIIKADHLKALRAYMKRVNGMGMNDLFSRLTKGTYSQFGIMCSFLWHKYRSEYTWYIEDYANNMTAVPFQYQTKEQAGIKPAMLYPKPRVAIHTTYHVPGPSEEMFQNVLKTGFCYDKRANGWTSMVEMWCLNNGVSTDDENRNQFDFERADHELPLSPIPGDVKKSFGERQTRRKECPHRWNSDQLTGIGFTGV